MSTPIYLVSDDGLLIEMQEQPYAAEALLQELLASYPNLLDGDRTRDARQAWVLVAREAALPSEQDGAGRWSVDHLFLDREGIPTLVEVKRSSDTRIRREVVGQMLDYAANAVLYWPIEKLRQSFERTAEAEGILPEARLHDLLGEGDGEADPEEYWTRVKTNLQAGRVRMVFVADEIPRELRRIVEFLNEQMDPAEVLAVEIKQFVGEGRRTLVPRTIGLTAESERKKGAGPRPQRVWNEETFLLALKERSPEEAVVARALLAWAKDAGLRIWWGKGMITGSMIPILDQGGTAHALVALWTNGVFVIQFAYMMNRTPFDDAALRTELAQRLKEIPGIELPADSINRYPSVPLAVLRDGEMRARFLEVLDWGIGRIREAETPR